MANYYFGKIGKMEYNSEIRECEIVGGISRKSESIVIMNTQIGNSIQKVKENTYKEVNQNGFEAEYKYINDGKDLEINWKWVKPSGKGNINENLKESIKNDSDKNINEELNEELKIFIATIYGESAASSEIAWEAIANVIMNRVGEKEWKKYDTVEKIIKYTGFDAYTLKNTPYKIAESYLKNRTGNNLKIEKLINIVINIYYNEKPDITNGALLYYSPKAQETLHNKYPNKYLKTPKWNFSLLEEIKIKGAEKDDFKFYKYK